MRTGDLVEAEQCFEHCILKQPDFIDGYMQLAYLNYQQNELSVAVRHLESAIALDSFYAAGNLFDLADLYLRLLRPVRATRLLNRYLASDGITERRKYRAQRMLGNAEFMSAALENPVQYKPEELPGDVNSAADEVLPAFTVDGLSMFFTRREGGQEDLYTAHWDASDGAWRDIQSLTEINTRENEGAHTVSADGKSIVFTACGRRDGLGSCDLYIVEFRNGRWSKPENIGAPVNTSSWESQPSLSADGNTLYFASARSGGIGKRDLWKTDRLSNGHWSKPANLGPTINTKQNDESPFMHADGETLYFMSDGHSGMGDYDLYVAKRIGNAWKEPRNLGYPINTSGREGALVVHPNGRQAYFAAAEYKLGLQRADHDIYTFELDLALRPEDVSFVRISVFDARSNKPVEGTVDIINRTDGESVARQIARDGEAVVTLINGRDYGLHVEASGYLFYSDQFLLQQVDRYSALMLNVPLLQVDDETEVEEKTPIILRNVLFASGSAELLDISEYELTTLRQFLEAEPGIQIEIRGHTDDIGQEQDNMKLSTARARAVFDYLVERGVSPDRLSFRGFGESIPIASNATAEGRRENRRTEFVIR